MEKAAKIIEILKDNGLPFDGWYMIGELMYINCRNLSDTDKVKIKSLFREVDIFKSYETVSIDTNKQ